MRPLRPLAARFAPHAIVVAFALAAVWPLLRAAGMPYNVDISGFFPLTREAYEARFWPLWNERGGMSAAQFLPALLFELPLLVVGRVFDLEMATAIKLRILVGLVIAGLGMLVLTRYYLRRHHPGAPAWIAFLVPLSAALLFMLNPWSVHRIFHYFLWLGYVLAPWVVLAFERLAERPGWQRALILALVTALATTDPHNPPYLAILLVPLGIVRLWSAARASASEAWRLTKHVGLAIGVYAGLCAFWVLPYLHQIRSDPAFGPTYVLSDQMLGVLSQNGDILNVLRLTHNYLPRAPLTPEGGIALAMWNVASLAIPLLAVHALILRPKRAASWAYAAIAAGCIALGMGDRLPIAGAYRWLLFDAPWGEGLSWLFRDPYRWGGAQAFAYAVLVAFALAELCAIVAKWKRAPARLGVGIAAPTFTLACVALVVVPGAMAYMEGPFAPVEVPSEYAEANTHLDGYPDDERVVWMPRMLGSTTWSGPRTMAYFDATSSARPALGPFRPHTSAYFDTVAESAREGGPTSDLLARAGVGTVVLHNDRSPMRDAWTLRRLVQADFAEDATFGQTPTPVLDGAGGDLPGAPASRYAVHGTRVIAQTFSVGEVAPHTLTLTVRAAGSPPPLRLEILDDGGKIALARTLALPPDATTFDLDLADALSPGEAYELRASVSGGGRNDSAADKYEVSYYTVDAYEGGRMATSDDGARWREHAGDVRFVLAARGSGFITLLASPTATERFRLAPAPIASPAGLDLLATLALLPGEAAQRDASVVFTHSAASARAGFAANDLPWHWVADLAAGELEATVPHLPEGAFVAPFKATTSADHKTGWARGTPTFTYYEWGWPHALNALKAENADFDLGRGLVFTSADARLDVPVEPADAPRTLLARVFEGPQARTLTFHAGSVRLGAIDARADVAAFRWVEVGEVPAGASRVTLATEGGFQAVNLLALADADALAAAKTQGRERLDGMPITLLTDGDRLGANVSTVTIPGVGAFSRLREPADVDVEVPRADAYTLWVRASEPTRAPLAAMDGASPMPMSCGADCDAAAQWYRLPLGQLSAGEHTLRLVSANDAGAMIDALAIASADADLARAEASTPTVAWKRLSATRFEAKVDAEGPALLVFREAYDAGWVARTDDGHTLKPILVDGLTVGYAIDGPTRVVVSYEPQRYAHVGAFLSAATASLAMAAVAIPAWRKREEDD